MPSLERHGDVFVLILGTEDGSNPENRFSPVWLDQVNTLLDQVLDSEGPAALVFASDGKFFSNGLDVEYVSANLANVAAYLDRVHALYSRVLTLPLPTVAAVQGHAFGAGAMLALSTDHAIMRADRGFFCLPEVNLGMPFPPGMNALVTSRMPARTALDAMTSGRRYSGADALAAGIVDAAVGEDDLRGAALARAASLAATRGPNLAGIKTRVHGSVLEALAVVSTPETFTGGR